MFKAILRIDVCSLETGEIFESFDNVWIGDAQKVYSEISTRYSVDNIERCDNDSRTVWVMEG